jgi:hypothetical protein
LIDTNMVQLETVTNADYVWGNSQTGRQTEETEKDRQANRQIETEKDRQADRQKETEKDRQANRQCGRQGAASHARR